METLFTIYPNVQDLLATLPEDLAPVLLTLAKGMVQNGMFYPDAVNDAAIAGPNALHGQPGYPIYSRRQIQPLLSQAWGWIERNDLITSAGGMNGRNGWMMFTPKGEQVSDATDIQRLREAADFPKWMIHPSIQEKVWRALMRNDLGDAVLFAFRAVEEAVRSAGGFTANDIGVDLMRAAFNKDKGPLTDPSQPAGERDALPHLFAGAIGSYKNPHSHRTVKLGDVREAQEQVVLASHLLRIVDARRKTMEAKAWLATQQDGPIRLSPGENRNIPLELKRDGPVDVIVRSIIPDWAGSSAHSGTPELNIRLTSGDGSLSVERQLGISAIAAGEFHAGPVTISIFNFEANPPVTFEITTRYPE